MNISSNEIYIEDIKNIKIKEIQNYIDAGIKFVYRKGNYITESDAKILEELDARPQRIEENYNSNRKN